MVNTLCSFCFGGDALAVPLASDVVETMPFDVSLAATPVEPKGGVVRNLDPEFARVAYQNKRNKDDTKEEKVEETVEEPKDEKIENAAEGVEDVKDQTKAVDEEKKEDKEGEAEAGSKEPLEENPEFSASEAR